MRLVSACLLLVPLLATQVAAARPRLVRGQPATPTSATLIARALAGGRLDAETALTYQVYAAFADCRLPAEYQGDDSSVQGTMILAELAAKLETLSPAARANLSPFLLEPYEPGGWVERRETLCSAGKKGAPSAVTTRSLSVLGGKVAITYRTNVDGEEAKAQQIAEAVEQKIYPALAGLMDREPLPYTPTSTRRWNLSLVTIDSPSPGRARFGTTSFLGRSSDVLCKPGPAFSQVDTRNAPFLATVAHELMHAIQFGYELAVPCLVPEYWWLADATATWAEDYVYPTGDSEHETAHHFLARPEVSLDCRSDIDCPGHEYGAYLFPFYIHKRFEDALFVRRIWQSAGSNLSLDAVDVALTPHGGFKEQWPEFARYNWNREPFHDYRTWDRLVDEAKADETSVVRTAPDRKFELESAGILRGPLELEHLSAQYFHFKIDDPEVRSVAFWNGVTWKLSLEDVQGIGRAYQTDDPDPNQIKGGHVEALIKVRGQAWKKADWTDEEAVTFCRDRQSEMIDELVVIVSNSDKDRSRTLKPPDLPPLLWVSNMGCAEWTGSADMMVASEFGHFTISVKDIRWKQVEVSRPPMRILYRPESGTLNWSFSATGCSGQGTLPILLDGMLITYNFIPSEGAAHRAYHGFAGDGRLVTAQCTGGPIQIPLLPWLVHPAPAFVGMNVPMARTLRVKPDGVQADDSWEVTGGGYRWRFEAKKEQ